MSLRRSACLWIAPADKHLCTCTCYPAHTPRAARAALELQNAICNLEDSRLLHMPRLEVPAFASELHGSFADLVQQLQECVHHRRDQGVKNFKHGPASRLLLW